MSDTLDEKITAARLIDPEDARINVAINSRGYFVRVAVSREVRLLKDGWMDAIQSLSKETLLISFDQKVKEDKTTDYGTLVFDFGDAIAVLFLSSSSQVFFHFWSNSIEISREYCKWVALNIFENKAKDILDEEKNIRDITFWGQSGSDYEAFNRKLTLRTWEQHAVNNYPTSVLSQLKTLSEVTPPILGGKIILMHGAPGTGKTSFIQVLARKWTKWCHTSCITDPENFLGNPGSMLKVLTWDFNSYISEDVMKENAYHLLIIEDADELISQDAQRQSGQALSRLLNIGDGLVGQSTNLLICITTNVNIQNLHPAVSRAGRCLAKIEFTGFSKDEAAVWIQSHNGDIDPNTLLKKRSDESYTLAELYELLAGSKQISHIVPKTVTGQYL